MVGGNFKEFIYMKVTDESIQLYERYNTVQGDMITELPLYKKYRPGSSGYRETVMQLINNLTGDRPVSMDQFE